MKTWTLTDQSVREVDDEVETDVGQKLFVDQFVDGSSPPEENLVETTETAGVAHSTRVGDCHGVKLWLGLDWCWDCYITAIATSQDHRKQLELSWRGLIYKTRLNVAWNSLSLT